MKSAQCSTSGVVVLAGIALLVSGCHEDPVGPDRPGPVTTSIAEASATGDRYLVLMKETQGRRAPVSTLDTPILRLGGRIERSLSEIGVLQVGGLTAAAAAQLAGQAEVEAVAKDRRVQWLPPNEQRIGGTRQLGIRTESTQRDAGLFFLQWNIKRIRAPQAWDVSQQGRGVTVCILDTGIDPRHEDLAGKLNREISASFVAGERADRDLNFHGTAIASIVTSQGVGLASVAPDARLCSVKVLDRTGSGSWGDIASGMMHVGTAGILDGPRVTVANMSFGLLFRRGDPDLVTLTSVLQRAVNFSTRHGVLFVASAGNEGVNLNDPDFIRLPAELDNVIAVGATGPINQTGFDRIASYSNVGRRDVDVFAPGGEVAFPRNVIEDQILAACSASIGVPGFEACRAGNVYLNFAGTSPAAAHVAGEAAVIESELPGNQSPAELTACILNNADPLPNPLLTANGRINVLRGQGCGVR